MSNGMQILLKQLGIDPERLQKDISAMATGIKTAVENQNAALARIETKLDLLLEQKPDALDIRKPN